MSQTKQHIKRGLTMFILLIAIASLLISCGKNKSTEQEENENLAWIEELVIADLGVAETEVVATYEGGEVTAGEFEHYLHLLTFFSPEYPLGDSTYWPDILNSFVGEKILKEKAAAAGIEVDREEAAETYKRQREAYVNALQGEDVFNRYLAKLNLTDQAIEDFFAEYSTIDKYFLGNITDEDIKNMYEEQVGRYTIVSVRHILTKTDGRTDEEAKNISEGLYERLKKGEDFATLANEYTEDEGNGRDPENKKGGLIENFPANSFVPEFAKASIELPLNEISEPVKTDYGYHIVRVEERTVKSLSEVQEELKMMIANQRHINFMTVELPKMDVEITLPSQ